MSENQQHVDFVKPSDAKSWSLCARRVWFDNHPPEGLEIEIGKFDQLVIDLGLAHEKAILEKLSQDYEVHEALSVEHTTELMEQGVDIIYQAQLLDEKERFIGFPDFLFRHESSQYQAADAKLSLSGDKKEIQVQLGFYRRMLNNGLPAIVFHGDGSQSEIGDESDKVVNRFITEIRELMDTNEMPIVHYGHSKCKACSYYGVCRPYFEEKESLSFIYGIQGRAATGLEKEGILTISQFISSKAEDVPDVPYLKGTDKKHKAILQAKSWKTGEVFKLNDVSLPEGTWVHFDIEDNPLTPTGKKHVYLWGFLIPGYTNVDFEYVWTDTEDQDRQGWIQFLGKVEGYRNSLPDLILAHYCNHERTTIEKHAERYSMEDNETVLWLLGEDSPLFDIQKPVTDNLVLPLQGYGLKDICKHKDLVNFQWEDDDSGSQWSIVQFNRFLAETDPQKKEKLKTEILGYNRDDVVATRRLEEWLRAEFIEK